MKHRIMECPEFTLVEVSEDRFIEIAVRANDLTAEKLLQVVEYVEAYETSTGNVLIGFDSWAFDTILKGFDFREVKVIEL